MNFSRRQALLSTLFGTGMVGLRALATGLPVSLLLDPRKALADPGGCAASGKAQYIVFNTSMQGDPINANCPGTYEDPNINHPLDPAMAATKFTMSGKTYTAAKPWSTLPQNVLDRTLFFHLMTGTPVHPRERDVLELMGGSSQGGSEMLPSLLAKAVAPCLGTIQAQPVSLGAGTPAEALTFGGNIMPTMQPTALKDTLTNPAGPLTKIQALRDQTMNQIYGIYKNVATPPQQQFIDSLVTSQNQARELNQSLLSQLSALKDDTYQSQLSAALVLIQLNVAPVLAVHIDFGSDNHGDPGLAGETAAHVSALAALGTFMQSLESAGLQDKVTFMSLNVFGRSLANNPNGRTHNGNHHVSLCIGKPFRGGTIGGCAPVLGDYGCTSINSSTGAGGAGGDIQAADTLSAFAQTMLAAVGGNPTVVGTSTSIAGASTTGKLVTAALA